MEMQKTQNSKNNLKKRTKLEDSYFLLSKHNATVIKTVWYWHRTYYRSLK